MPSVLIVDDDPRVRELLRRWLEPSGYALRFAENAHAAVAALSEERAEVIVCDVHMPGPNGLWLADRVRDIAPTTAIVLATGDSTVPPFESLRRAVVAYVLKPFQREQLVRAVSAGVEWSESAAAERRGLRRARPRLAGANE
jgi:DNA-binding NtrC family response regulator